MKIFKNYLIVTLVIQLLLPIPVFAAEGATPTAASAAAEAGTTAGTATAAGVTAGTVAAGVAAAAAVAVGIAISAGSTSTPGYQTTTAHH
jgi:hypothetical protein